MSINGAQPEVENLSITKLTADYKCSFLLKSLHGPPAVRVITSDNQTPTDKLDVHYIEYDSTYKLEELVHYTDYIDGTKTSQNVVKGIFYDPLLFEGGELPWVYNTLNPTASGEKKLRFYPGSFL